MRKLVFLIPLFVLCSGSFGQSVLNSTGASLASGTYVFDVSVGELAIETLSGSSEMMTEGVLQPKYDIQPAIESEWGNSYFCNVSPNPFLDEITIETNYLLFDKVSLYMANGQLIWEKTFDYKALNVGNLAQGSYLLNLSTLSPSFTKTFKLIKL